jgi:hypothetical protein
VELGSVEKEKRNRTKKRAVRISVDAEVIMKKRQFF